MKHKPITIRTGQTSDTAGDLKFLHNALIGAGFMNTLYEDKLTMEYPQSRLDLLVGVMEELLPEDFNFSIVIGILDTSQQFDDTISFGKYKGKTVDEVLKFDPSWIVWANRNVKTFKVSKETISLAWEGIKNKKK